MRWLASIQVPSDRAAEDDHASVAKRSRVIPTVVKLAVSKRDGGRSVECCADNELHFDHVVAFSKGGSSLVADNVQFLCARHNLLKSDKIQ
ncbi:MAG: 5-methylcytosine-specific restriction endonuclease McrA [Candidatus Azotimanducaceae bacterium]|jgi:5-methylcytosine-specific restriction endonuclease McrA